MSELNKPSYGEIKCQGVKKSGDKCENGAYYCSNGQYLCGVHSRSDTNRCELIKTKKNIDKENITYESIIQAFPNWKLANPEIRSQPGDIILSKMGFMKGVPDIENYIKVYPNYKHQNKAGGLGMSSLSPMALGPVNHGQPHIGPAKNLENFHQGNKCYKDELNVNGEPSEIFYQNQQIFYNDDTPHRHKREKEKPVYSVWINKKGGYKINYVESRQFYCNFYERLVSKEDDFRKLKDLHDKGVNLQICGYDAYPLTKETIEDEYLNPERPFGHERVLCSMLLLEPKDYPWKKHKTFKF